MKAVMSNEVGKQICEYLDIPINRVQEIHIHLVAGRPVEVDIRLSPTKSGVYRIVPLFKNYQLLPKKVTESVEEIEEDRG